MGKKSYPVPGLGQQIAATRFRAGLTLRELSARTGIDPGPLSRIERGLIIDPGFGVIVQIAKALALDLNMLAGKKMPADRKKKTYLTFRRKYDRPLRRKLA